MINSRILFTRYVIFGMISFAINIAILVVINHIFRKRLPKEFIYTIAAGIGMFVSFTSQKIFVWRTKNKIASELPKFICLSLVTYVTNILFIFIFVRKFHLNFIKVEIITAVILATTTFLASKKWVFFRETPASDGR